MVLSATTTCYSRSYLLINLSIFHRCNGGIGLVIHPIIYVLADIYVKVNKLNTWLPLKGVFFFGKVHNNFVAATRYFQPQASIQVRSSVFNCAYMMYSVFTTTI